MTLNNRSRPDNLFLRHRLHKSSGERLLRAMIRNISLIRQENPRSNVPRGCLGRGLFDLVRRDRQDYNRGQDDGHERRETTRHWGRFLCCGAHRCAYLAAH